MLDKDDAHIIGNTEMKTFGHGLVTTSQSQGQDQKSKAKTEATKLKAMAKNMASRARPRPNIPDVVICRLRLEGVRLGLGLEAAGLGLDCVVKDSDLSVMDFELDSAVAGLDTSLAKPQLHYLAVCAGRQLQLRPDQTRHCNLSNLTPVLGSHPHRATWTVELER